MTDPTPPAFPPSRSRVRIGLGAAVVLVLVALGCAVLAAAFAPRGESTIVGSTGAADVTAAPNANGPAASSGIFVHILGEVSAPGLYELREGDRAVDVVAAAGGFTDDADQGQLNLARVVTDGEQIVVPKVGETPASGSPREPGVDASGKISLNTADVAQLEELPQIGPALAERIIAWRDENGGFTAVEDLLSVPGIGDKTFEGLRDLVIP